MCSNCECNEGPKGYIPPKGAEGIPFEPYGYRLGATGEAPQEVAEGWQGQ